MMNNTATTKIRPDDRVNHFIKDMKRKGEHTPSTAFIREQMRV